MKENAKHYKTSRFQDFQDSQDIQDFQDFQDVIFLYLEHTKNKKIVKDLNINFWSTIAVYKNNKEIAKAVGLVDKQKIYTLIKTGI